MDLWIPSIVTTGALAFAVWFGRELISTWLLKNVAHKFNEKLEAVRVDFREKEKVLEANLQLRENEIRDLRSGAMTAMASRQMALDKRRLDAVDQLWSSMVALSRAKNISSLMTAVNFDAASEEATRNPRVREAFTKMGAAFEPKRLDLSGAEKARPFVSPRAWALFSPYQAIVIQAVVKLEIIKSGIGFSDLLEKEAVVKVALPHLSEFIDNMVIPDTTIYWRSLRKLCSQPYIRCLPEKRQTNPAWNEQMIFLGVPMNEWQNRRRCRRSSL